jgi:16S rRNA (guanine527-N7)-methyltransferase
MGQLWADLVAANAALNLTRITAEGGFWVRHVADSLAVGRVVPALLAESLAVADVGCGAGFPLLPLAWANPALRLAGFESRGGKAAFAAGEAQALGLRNATVVARRAREAARLAEHAGRYDVVLARAVGSAGALVRECRGLLRPEPGAMLVHYKTPQAAEAELPLAGREAAKYGFAVEVSDALELPDGGGTRQFLLMRRLA